MLYDPVEFAPRAAIPDDLAPDCRNEIVLDPKGIIKECSHFNEAWRTGGKTHNQGLWMQTVLASTWFQNGRKFAHKFSDGYPTYTTDETDAMYDRKVNDRKSMGLGWPSCKAFRTTAASCALRVCTSQKTSHH